MRGSRPTLEAVAAHAGVSRATVSRVVNGVSGVRAPVRERVLRAVAELGYVPNNAARSLVTRRTGAVAVVVAASRPNHRRTPLVHATAMTPTIVATARAPTTRRTRVDRLGVAPETSSAFGADVAGGVAAEAAAF